jgi:hypothetical protein
MLETRCTVHVCPLSCTLVRTCPGIGLHAAAAQAFSRPWAGRPGGFIFFYYFADIKGLAGRIWLKPTQTCMAACMQDRQVTCMRAALLHPSLSPTNNEITSHAFPVSLTFWLVLIKLHLLSPSHFAKNFKIRSRSSFKNTLPPLDPSHRCICRVPELEFAFKYLNTCHFITQGPYRKMSMLRALTETFGTLQAQMTPAAVVWKRVCIEK